MERPKADLKDDFKKRINESRIPQTNQFKLTIICPHLGGP